MVILVAMFIYLVARALMTISSVITFIQIVCIRKHHQLLYILIPLCFLVSGAIGFALEIFAIKLKLEGKEDYIEQVALPLVIHYLFYTTGHQLFAS